MTICRQRAGVDLLGYRPDERLEWNSAAMRYSQAASAEQSARESKLSYAAPSESQGSRPLSRDSVLAHHPNRIIRVFPRRTRATPDDDLVYTGPPDLFAEADEVHVSVTFTWDKDRAEQLAEQWRFVAPVKIGGVAYNDTSLEFLPGQYIRPGYTITSRGCPRRCWFCGVWKKWPTVNVLPIYDGWNILDDNVLAAPRPHVEAVFDMLRRQRKADWPDWDGRVEFTGGLEALSLGINIVDSV